MDDVFVLRYARTGILLDSPLLCLLLMGSFDRSLVGKYKRLGTFLPEEFDLLSLYVQQFDQLVTTPHVLTEVSNLSGALAQPMLLNFREHFRQRIAFLHEEHEFAHVIANAEVFHSLGLADTAIATVAEAGYLVMTEDFNLYSILWSLGIDTINFNHIRGISWP